MRAVRQKSREVSSARAAEGEEGGPSFSCHRRAPRLSRGPTGQRQRVLPLKCVITPFNYAFNLRFCLPSFRFRLPPPPPPLLALRQPSCKPPLAGGRNFLHLACEKRSGSRDCKSHEIKLVFPMAQEALPLCGLYSKGSGGGGGTRACK